MGKKAEDFKLWSKYKSEKREEIKKKLKTQLVEKYYSLVKTISYKVAERLNWNVTPEELTSFGIDGLYVAIDRFDLTRGIKFESYASTRIRGSMIDNLRKEDVIPRSVRINNNQFEKVKNELESKQGERVREEEIIDEMGVDKDKYIKNVKNYTPAIFSSVDGLMSNNQNTNEYLKKDQNINLIDNNTQSPDSGLKRKEFFNKLLSKNFSKMERKIIYLYYYENLTMERVAEDLELSESRVSQIHKELLKRLKDKIKRNPKYFSDDVYSFVREGNDKDSLF